jgi:hypothetical protein
VSPLASPAVSDTGSTPDFHRAPLRSTLINDHCAHPVPHLDDAHATRERVLKA